MTERMWEQVKAIYNKIKEFVRERESLISGVLAVLILIGWVAFVLGFVFAHGVCCGDDAVLGLWAKEIVESDFKRFIIKADPHLGVLLPVSLGIYLAGSTLWVPGLAVVVIDTFLLGGISALLHKYNKKIWFVVGMLVFFYLNFVLMSKHFEHWYAALGEVPAGLLVITGILLYHHRDQWFCQITAGFLCTIAFLTKMTAGVAVLAVLTALFIQFIYSLFSDIKTFTILKGFFFFCLGLIIPFVIFEILNRSGLVIENYRSFWISNFIRVTDSIQNRTLPQLLTQFQKGKAVFVDRFGIPFISFPMIAIAVGIMIREDTSLKRIYLFSLTILFFWSLWWFLYSIHWARHYLVSILVLNLIVVLPFLGSQKRKWRGIYFSAILVWSMLTLKQIDIPFNQLTGHFFEPTDKSRALIKVSGDLSEQVDEEVVITQNTYTISDIRYMLEHNLKYAYFNSNRRYAAPFWIAVNTKFMDYSDQSFQRFLRGCSGLREYEGYLAGRCE